jgi:benzoate membrane transport protein
MERESMDDADRGNLHQPISAGIVAALVGSTSTFAVVLTGLASVGATSREAASGLLALCITQAVGILWLSRRHRIPVTLAWSTPGAAVLVGTSLDGGWPAAVGAFLVAGAAYVVTGLWPALGRLIGRIPVPIAQAMLAGVVLPLCLEPVTALRDDPASILPVVLVWLVGVRLFPRWAVPVTFVAAAVVIGVDMVRDGTTIAASDLVPQLAFTAPTWSWQAMIGVALPLYVVTMASQNVPGVAIMKSLGYDVPWRSSIVTAGIATMAGATAGGYSVNLSAVSAALSAGPPAGPDLSRRWISAQAAGGTYIILAATSAALAALVAVAPAGVIATVAGLALVGTLAAALEGAVTARHGREAAVIAFLVAASGVTAWGIGSAFWALIAGLVVHLVLDARPRRAA